MAREIISYQEFDGANGLALEQGVLTAYADGEVIGRAKVSGAADLGQLMRTYEIQYLLPDLIFCYDRPAWYEVMIDYTGSIKERREVHGTILFEGRPRTWSAKFRSHPDFGHGDLVPTKQRPWVRPQEVEKSMGLEFYLPQNILDYDDPVVCRRIAIALEEFVYALRDPRFEIKLPRPRAFGNMFSADTPMWAANLPRVCSVPETDFAGYIAN